MVSQKIAPAFIEHTVTVRVPLNIVYNQWTQFESYPYFMENIIAVQPLSDIRLLWLGDITGELREWYTEITQAIPNQLLAWKSTSGPNQWVTVRFALIDENTTRLTCHIMVNIDDFSISPDFYAAAVKRISGDLQRFKTFIEDERYHENVWRDEVKQSIDALWNEAPVPVRRKPVPLKGDPDTD